MSEDAHAARPIHDAPEPLYDANISTPTQAERARTLVAKASTGTLCTVALDPKGYPYGSFVTVAFDDGKPVSTPEEVRAALISMVKDARSKLGSGAREADAHCNRSSSLTHFIEALLHERLARP